MISIGVAQQLDALNGTYSPSEARDILANIIDYQINFYKLKHLSQWERNHNASAATIDNKIKKLVQQKKDMIELTNKARLGGLRITLGGTLELSLKK